MCLGMFESIIALVAILGSGIACCINLAWILHKTEFFSAFCMLALSVRFSATLSASVFHKNLHPETSRWACALKPRWTWTSVSKIGSQGSHAERVFLSHAKRGSLFQKFFQGLHAEYEVVSHAKRGILSHAKRESFAQTLFPLGSRWAW